MAVSHFFCIDGTNLVRGLFGYGGPNFREQENADRERLIAGLSQLCENLGDRLEIEVYFDGDGRFSADGEAANLRVRFAREIEADELILDRVRCRRHEGSGSVTVVTSDGELGRMAAEEGGRWLKVAPATAFESVVASIERRFSQ
ncbi:MAG: hypothetical protein A3J74_05025 [Elusimicrobia bacterium RIFCSPHIGHO2_02_FULL_57_9]|nr:MAG: hypothetical protein A3J74_05025 [Elusimicrobia bacterium RIFCSPHIGHO2_02_FULL_57_9]